MGWKLDKDVVSSVNDCDRFMIVDRIEYYLIESDEFKIHL